MTLEDRLSGVSSREAKAIVEALPPMACATCADLVVMLHEAWEGSEEWQHNESELTWIADLRAKAKEP